jgi:dihydropteroate synthase
VTELVFTDTGWEKKTYVMGIINATPDSFSGDGINGNIEAGVSQALSFYSEGADILDIGGESTRPQSLYGNVKDISGKEEINRVVPLVKEIRARSGGMISVDTSKSAVADAAIKAGANMVNDVWALKKDPEMVEVVASAKVYVVLMHNDSNPSYSDVVYDTIESLKKSVDKAVRDGISEDLIIIDPGIGFGKDMRQNLTILRRLEEYKSIGRPILVGTSRKSTIGNILQVPVHERTYGTAASIAIAIAKGTNIVRVHDVGEMAQVCKMSDAIIREGAQ